MMSYASLTKAEGARSAVVGAVAMLGAFGSAWLVESLAALGAGVVVLAVVITVTLARVRREGGGRWQPMAELVVVPVAAAVAGGVGLLLHAYPWFGDAVFVAGLSLTVWVRRFGARATKAGTLAAMPFVAVLVTPVPEGGVALGWCVLIALVAVCWVWACQAVARRAGFLGAVSEPAVAPSASANVRMALQLAVALAVAFAVGRLVFAPHWAWTVLTAYVVSSGNRGRGDVLHKSGLRLAGALAGTVAATELSGVFAPGNPVAIAVILAVLAVAAWLRTLSYAYWAGAVTAVLALLYGYYGETGSGLLAIRLEAIVAGALIAVAAAWFVMPVRTIDVLRKQVAEVRTALLDLAAALREGSADLEGHALRFQHAADRLEQVVRPLRAHRRLTRWRRPGPHHADVIDTVRESAGPVRAAVAGRSEADRSEASHSEAGRSEVGAELDRAARRLGLFLRSTRPAP